MATSVGDFDRLALFDKPEKLARPLSKLPYAH